MAGTSKINVEGGLNVSASNPLPVYAAPAPSGVTPDSATTGGGTKTVASTGTPEILAASGTAREVLLFPLSTNTGDVHWGFSSSNGNQHGIVPVIISHPDGKLVDLATIYLDVTVNGEGVRYETLT